MATKVYTTPTCTRCPLTIRILDSKGIDYELIDLAEHPELVEDFKARGLASAPIVVTETDEWAGHRMDKLVTL